MKDTIVIGENSIVHLNHQAAKTTPYVHERHLVLKRSLPLMDQRFSLVTAAELA